MGCLSYKRPIHFQVAPFLSWLHKVYSIIAFLFVSIQISYYLHLYKVWHIVSFLIKGLCAVFPTVLHTIKTLSIYVFYSSVEMVLSFMSCFPCLEKLYIEVTVHLCFVVLTAKLLLISLNLYVFLFSARCVPRQYFVAS
jgi:hypothetical protein